MEEIAILVPCGYTHDDLDVAAVAEYWELVLRYERGAASVGAVVPS